MGIQINGQTDTISAVDGSITVATDLTVPGALTYEDVTNIDSVGVVTARSGLHVTGGSVGIGTDNPITKLVVNSGNTNLATQIVSDDAEVFLAFKDGDSTGNQQVQIGGVGNNFVAYAGGNERLRISSNGAVCIGSGYQSSGGGQLTIRGLGVNSYAVQDYQYVGTPSSNNTLSQIRFTANTSGASVIGGARIQAAADADWSATGDAPTRLQFYTTPNGSASQLERLRITSAGQMLLGTTTEGAANADNLTIADSGHAGMTIRSGTSSKGAVFFSDATSGSGEYEGVVEYNHSDNNMLFFTSGSEGFRVDSSQRLLVNTDSAMETFGSAALQVATAVGGTLVLGRDDTSVSVDNGLGAIYFDTKAGGSFAESAVISAEADAAQGSGDYPSRLVFKTTADGSGSVTERLRINSAGKLKLTPADTTSSYATTDGGIDIAQIISSTGTSSSQSIGIQFSLTKSGQTGAIAEIGAIREGSGLSGLVFRTRDNTTGRNERLRITSTGDVGINCTPHSNAGINLHIHGDNTTSEIRLTNTTTGTGANGSYIQQGGNTLYIGNSESGNTVFEVNGSERLRITSDGKMGLGTNSPSSYIGGGDTFVIAGSGAAGMTIATGTSSTGTINFADGTSGDTRYRGRFEYSHSLDALDILTASGTRMRVTNDGKVRIKMSDYSSDPSASNSGLQLFDTSGGSITSSASVTSGSSHAVFLNPNGVCGTINTSGSSTQYNTSSDYRMKENVVDLDGAITRVKQLAPKRFNFITDADTIVDGFLAHEAQTVVPEAVTGTHNEVDSDNNPVYQGIDQSKLVPLLTAALQEAITKIETLEARITALEG